MPDLRLEDLRAMDSVDGVIVGRRVSRREVLEALGAEKRWVCVADHAEWSPCNVPLSRSLTGAHPMWTAGHAGCGQKWVVDDE